MNYGFVIDNRKCIGCHACSTACKSENEVPLGVNRTWVKYVETGTFPNTRRHFQVTRCNHCANPPCVRICPVTAMYQRADGIVEFDGNVCIGCKACMQACPYDAIYIDPDDGTAAKCHYCAHRTDIGLEPACVVVCPEHAIIAGDMDDPNSEISFLLASQDVTVRKPEQGTAPKLFYIDGNDAALHPTAVARTPESFMWADVIPLHGKQGSRGDNSQQSTVNSQQSTVNSQQSTVNSQQSTVNSQQSTVNSQQLAAANSLTRRLANSLTRRLANSPTRQLAGSQPQALPWNGPIQIAGTVAEQMVQVAYNAQHKIPWHWPVPAYLVTKAIGAGLFIILSLGLGLNWFAFDSLTAVTAGFLSLLFIGITTGLLVYDLEKPERFLTILLRPQWKSWLARGAFILVGFTLVAGIWWLLEAGAYLGLWPESLAATGRPIALWLGLALAIGAAVYTAFLFAQAEGRDLWQSSLLPLHMLLQSLVAGSGAYLVLNLFLPMPAELARVVTTVLVTTLLLDLFAILFGEFGVPHASEVAARAAHNISHGRYRRHFWWGSIALGHAVPLVLLLVAIFAEIMQPGLAAAAGLCAIAGLYLFEYAYIMAPQEIPNS